MGYNYKTNIFTFDFQEELFPVNISMNVLRYIYPDLYYENDDSLSVKHMLSILHGDDKSQGACKVLDNLFYSYNGHCQLPPPEFDIISDSVENSELIRDNGYCKTIIHKHVGICRYLERYFDFHYDVTETISAYDDDRYRRTEFKKGKTKVIEHGHDYVSEYSYIHEACINYTNLEEQHQEQLRLNILIKEEEERWIEFRNTHIEELKAWLIPIIENCDRYMCDRQRKSVYGGYMRYGMVENIDHGQCSYCTGRCKFKETLIPWGEHSKEWYELGIDKLNIKYLK